MGGIATPKFNRPNQVPCNSRTTVLVLAAQIPRHIQLLHFSFMHAPPVNLQQLQTAFVLRTKSHYHQLPHIHHHPSPIAIAPRRDTQRAMSSKYAFTKTLKEVRFLFCQTSEHSAAVR